MKNSFLFIFIFWSIFSKAQEKPFFEEEVSYFNAKDSIQIGGTLTIPKEGKKFMAVIIISGSGAQDRDGTLFGHTIYKNLAENLSKRGIAVLRLDDRGVGKTSGKTIESTSADFINDVLAGIDFLKHRKEIISKKIGLVGHSEGGGIAPMVASKSKDVAFIVSMAGPGVEGIEVMCKQNFDVLLSSKIDSLSSKIYVDSFYRPMAKAFITDKNNDDFEKELIELIGKYKEITTEQKAKFLLFGKNEEIAKTFSKIRNKWYKYFFAFNPKPFWEQVRCPVLALNGSKDLQVDADMNLQSIETILKKNKNKAYKIVKLESLNHLFQTAKTGALSEYSQKTETPSSETLQIIGDWILERK